jgi:hypothetical protein
MNPVDTFARHLWSILILSSYLCVGLPNYFLPSGFLTKILYSVSRPALGPTQPPIQRVPGALSLGVKRPGSEADHSPPSSAEVKECVELYLHSPSTPSWCGAQLKHRDSFTFVHFSYYPYLQMQEKVGPLSPLNCGPPHPGEGSVPKYGE